MLRIAARRPPRVAARCLSAAADATAAEIDGAMRAAADAFPVFSAAPADQVAHLLRSAATEIESAVDQVMLVCT